MALERFPDSMHAEYNGHIFSTAAETTDLRITPVYDAAGRTVIHSVYAITILEYISPYIGGIAITPTANQILTAAAVKTAIAQLSKNAGVFKYQARGLGDLVINTGATKDVVWGPKPRVIGVKLHGGLTVQLTWSVEVAIPNCADASFRFALMEFCYKLSFDKDRQGYTTRTYSGFLRIPQTKSSVSSRTLTDSADNYLASIYPPMIPGFRRIPGSWVLSEDKCRGDFTIIDEQMSPNSPPPGVIECESNHVWRTANNFAHWIGTISATYDIDRANGKPQDATQAFVALVGTRLDDASKLIKGGGLSFGGLPAVGAVAAPGGFRVPLMMVAGSAEEPNIFGRTQVKLSVSYTAAGIGLDQILKNGGLWQGIRVKAGGDWKAWSTSVKTSLSARGHAQLVFRTNEDALVDLCGPGGPSVPGAGSEPIGAPPASPGLPPLLPIGPILGSIGADLLSLFPPPTPQSSWLYYRCFATIHADLGRIPVTTLPVSPLNPFGGGQGGQQQNSGQAGWDVLGPLPLDDGSAAQSPLPQLGSLLDNNNQDAGSITIQQRVKPRLYVTLSGKAVRAGYGIPQPQLVSVNGVTPTLVGTPYFTQGIVDTTSVPIVRAEWRMTYLFSDDAGGVPTQAVPVIPSALA